MKHLLRKYFHVTSLRRKMILSFSLLIISALAALQAANTYQTYIILGTESDWFRSWITAVGAIKYWLFFWRYQQPGIRYSARSWSGRLHFIRKSGLQQSGNKIYPRALERTIKKYSATRPYVPKVYLVNLDNQILDNSLQGMAAPEINCDPQTSSLCLSDVLAPYISQHTPVISFEKNIYSLYTGNQKLGSLL